MTKDLNKVMIIGRLGADPELRYTPAGTPVASFNVACGRRWTTPDGETHDETEWVRTVAWNKLAEICNQYLSKGSKIYVEGRLQTRSWDDQSGQKRYSTEVVANEMIMLDSRNSPERRPDDSGQPVNSGDMQDVLVDDVPF
ncbi:MAG: single-stranded DNA-binding protein [Chloroflexia bacterium]